MQTFKVGEDDVSKRADVFVSEQLINYTRASLKTLFERNLVRINGEPVKSGHKLRLNESVSIDTTLLETQPPEIEFNVIYEDDDVLVMDKPSGLLTHSKGAINEEASVASFLKKKIDDETMSGNRAGIVHRLDRHTSGVIIGAKNQTAASWLQKQFSLRKVKKTYIAVILGELSPKTAVVDVPIERNPKRPQTFRAGLGGKPAQTRYELVRLLRIENKTYTVVKLFPLTGRTHQLRVHMAYIGHPIVGDGIYGTDNNEPMLLHAEILELTLPGGKRRTFSSPLPVRFERFIKDNEK